MLDPRRDSQRRRIWPSPYFGGRWENADPDSKAINVLIWHGRYAGVAARPGCGAISGAGAILILDDAGGNPRSRRRRS